MVSSPPSISPILVSLTLFAGLSLDANVYSVSLCFFLCLSLILVCFDHTLFIRSQQCLSIYIVKCRICRYLVYHITCRLVFIIYFFLQFFGVLDVRIYDYLFETQYHMLMNEESLRRCRIVFVQFSFTTHVSSHTQFHLPVLKYRIIGILRPRIVSSCTC